MLGRREFVATLASAVAWPLAARAQLARLPTVGGLVLGTPDPTLFWRVFRERLHELGYREGGTVALEYRTAHGDATLLASLAAELVQKNVDVIVVFQTAPARAAMNATKVIPIVLGPAGDPVGTGLVPSLAHPGGNVTGLSGTAVDVAPKTLEFVREVIPTVDRVAVLAHAVDPFGKLFVEELQTGARKLGIETQTTTVRREEELDAAFADVAKSGARAVVIQPSISGRRAADLALRSRLAAFSVSRLLVEAGGLMSYSADLASLHREAAVYVDKILRGEKPADLPVQQPTKFELVINLKTAKALGIAVPPSLLVRADEVIE
jgi:putative ABC transport system substrate-binding protein